MLSLFGDSLGNIQNLEEVRFLFGIYSEINVLREKLSKLGFEPIKNN